MPAIHCELGLRGKSPTPWLCALTSLAADGLTTPEKVRGLPATQVAKWIWAKGWGKRIEH